MSVQNEPTFYGPELIGVLQEIFDLAWQEINAIPDYPISDGHADKRRNDLAEMIILAHRSGLRPEEIKKAVLGDIAHKRSNGNGG